MQSEKITLYFKQGSSDKVYHASLEEAGNNTFVVNFAYGRRGATLNTGTKTQTPVEYAAAKKIYDKLVKSKTSEGYSPGEQGSPYAHTDAESRDTGVQCQLLNFVEESQVIQYMQDAEWWAQEKFDGKRMLLHKNETVTAINRRGLSVGAPDLILKRANSVKQGYLVDGEAVGETLIIFDLLELDGVDLRSTPYAQRLAALEGLGFDGALVVAKTAKTAAEKQQMYDSLKASGTEGIVFKKQTAPYTAGRPNSGGNQVKFKFYATATVLVTQINDSRSVAVAVFAGDKQVAIGNVTIPPNKEVPAVNAIVEVRYLYAYRDGSLYQPTYIAVREDMELSDCSITQLKYKKETE